MKLIKKGVYVGTRLDAENNDNLVKNGISRVLTVDIQPLVVEDNVNQQLKTLYVNCLDEPTADLLTYFDRCIEFIDDGLANNEAVLVHCLSGVSRSITIILAYLMKSDGLTLDEAIDNLSKILSSSQKVSPNAGFLDQLRLYEEMDKKVDISSAVYKQYRLELLASQIQEGNQTDGRILSTFLEEVKSRNNSSNKIFRCRKCRYKVFDSSSLVEHDIGQGSASFGWTKDKKNGQQENIECTSLFVEPVEWMLTVLLGTLDGKLLCPKCNSRLGSFNWSGMQCSCASWVTPAFQFHKNKLDQINTVPKLLNNI